TKRLKIYGGWFGDETGGPPTRHGDPLRTVLDGDIAGDDSQGLYGDNAYHVLQITGVTGRSHKPGVILDRFVIRGGHSTLPNSQNLYGGGIYSSFSDLDITDCTIQNNVAELGGGLAFLGGQNINPDLYPSRLHIKRTTFSDNS